MVARLSPGLSSRCKQARGKREWLLYQFISLSFSLCDSNEKACPGNSLSRKYTEAGEGEMHVGEGGGLSSHLGGKMKAREERGR